MAKQDQLHRFLFEQHAVRGEMITVDETFHHILQNHDYPEAVKGLLGELLVATSLLTATLKFDGDITVQIQGDGPVKLAVINGNNLQQMRGVARVDGPVVAGSTLKQMIGNGFIVITITPKQGERYQGIVAIEGNSIEESIDAYFRQSEQLPTRLFIRVGELDGKGIAGGMLLQVLPAAENSSHEFFDHLVQLTATIKGKELSELDIKEVLHRLYHEEDVTLYDPQSVEFRCTCSRERCEASLITLSNEDVMEILHKDGKIDMECEFCGTHYVFIESDIEGLNNERNQQLH
ncbi:Heat shock protein 33 [Providencia rustigianii]|uniref:33 kDa chaperonin n=2 Tax=Providencia rustigianii TaxID=158850 RepID=D1P0D4_9GAMM|nr:MULTISPECIES: Hsp33 family molecular chaperone HslO [Providencia]EFB73132.1 chaperonin HslO [Providencia rustigianii DSM 4541]MTC56772.1 Hsp33 family molecular chaperone HslO [Providencia rustigianii]SPY76001.1 Heat shock protein 33 [Providencia rustigianii]SUC33955.1 Heat shock protein 33 [Providencia rustigianii]VEB62980.1 Heat shock protein 33 [Providencia rustigianii]